MPEILENEAALVYNLLSKMFVYDPQKCLSSREMLRHSWFHMDGLLPKERSEGGAFLLWGFGHEDAADVEETGNSTSESRHEPFPLPSLNLSRCCFSLSCGGANLSQAEQVSLHTEKKSRALSGLIPDPRQGSF